MDEQHLVMRCLSAGDAGAMEELNPLVFKPMRASARVRLSAEQSPTVQATALVHEAFLEFAGADIDWQDRAPFTCRCLV